MTKRLSRLIAILTQLQSKRIVKAQEIADRFGISLRTVYRDMQALTEAGIPIGSEAGVGYFLIDGYSLPPVSFTESEANALITAGKLIEQRGEKSLSAGFNEALLKVRSVLRGSEKDDADFLNSRISASVPLNPATKNHYLSDIQSAIVNNRIIQITYHSIYKDEKSSRKLEPLGIYFTDENWILVAYCRLRQDLREFRLDRITGFLITAERFSQRDFVFRDYFEKQINKSKPC